MRVKICRVGTIKVNCRNKTNTVLLEGINEVLAPELFGSIRVSPGVVSRFLIWEFSSDSVF